MRFCWGVLPSIYDIVCGSVGALCLGSRLLFAAWRQTGRLAISCVPIPPGRDRHSRVLTVSVRLSAFVGSLRGCAFFAGDLDGVTGDVGNGERGYGVGGAGFVRLCATALALLCFPRGVRWGLRAPKPAPKSLRLSGLSSRCGGVGVVRIRRACASLRGRIGSVSLSAGSTLGAARPKPAPKSRMWKRHCRLSGLSSRCGGVMLVRTRILARSTNAPIAALTLAKPGYTERPARL